MRAMRNFVYGFEEVRCRKDYKLQERIFEFLRFKDRVFTK